MSGYAGGRVQRRNLLPPTAISAATVVSQTENASVGRGLRLYIYCTNVTQGAGTDSVTLMAVPPDGGLPIAMAGITGSRILSTTGGMRYCIDFYPGQPQPGYAATGVTVAAAATYATVCLTIPLKYCVQVVLGTGDSATVAIDSEVLP